MDILCAVYAYIMVSILNQNEDIFELVLDDKVVLTHDTNRYRFRLPNENDVLGLPTGKHLSLITLNKEGEQVSRSYTPVSTDKNQGYVDFVIKIYKKNQHPDFPDGGFMSQKIDELNIGESFKFKGPNGRLEYLGNGEFAIKQLKSQGGEILTKRYKNIGMIAGGSGITPMIPIIRSILGDENDSTNIHLLFANKTEEDIILRDKLENRQEEFSHQYKYFYTISESNDNWTGYTGHINTKMLNETMPQNTDDTLILLCGPPKMISEAAKPSLEELNYSKENIFTF